MLLFIWEQNVPLGEYGHFNLCLERPEAGRGGENITLWKEDTRQPQDLHHKSPWPGQELNHWSEAML